MIACDKSRLGWDDSARARGHGPDFPGRTTTTRNSRMHRSTGNAKKPRTAPQVEALEGRALMATGAFVAPDLTPYIHAAFRGANTGPATIQTMLNALETQL